MAVACTENIEETPKTGSIHGIVYDKNVGDPIAVVQVQLSPGGNSTVTGSDGSFSFNNIEAGKYTVTVTKRGYNDGSNTVTVVPDQEAECNLLMERIPAYVTADKEVLDFGDNTSSNTLSFNIVNSSYENLSWHIEYDKSSTSFITEISPESGTTQYGKTAVIVVKIDREKLNEGKNETTIVVVSDNGDGSSEVIVQAIGQAKTKPSLNINSVSDITSSTAIVNGEITFAGIPNYTERGFAYSKSPNPVIGTTIEKLTAPVTEEASFSCLIKDLEFGVKYYVRAFAINTLGIVYSANQESFTTIASLPKVSLYSVDHLDPTEKTAALHGSIDFEGDPVYSEKGFVYCEGRKTPTINDSYKKVDGGGKGSFDASISALKLGSTYSVRACAKNEGGIAYSDKTIEFTLTGTSPIVNVGEVTNINLTDLTAVFHGSLESLGSPAATEKGFVYSAVNATPTISDITVKASSSEAGSYYVQVSQLSLGKEYKVRAYAKSEAGIVYSERTVSFSTQPSAPKVLMQSVTNVNLENNSALFLGLIEFGGDPSYSEKGFVYSYTNSSPTLNDSFIKVAGGNAGTYETTVTNLELGKTYYVRAYAINEAGTVYSKTPSVSFSLTGTAPVISVSEASNVNLSARTAVLNGYIGDLGYPAITERGFVYSNYNSDPSINDNKVAVSGTISGGSYSVSIDGLALDKTYYVKAYARNSVGLYYSSNTISFSSATTLPKLSISNPSDLNTVALTALVSGSIDDAGNPSYSEKGFVYGYANQLPTIESDAAIVVDGNQIGSYSATISKLVLGKKYYVRAYAKNQKGIAYSAAVSFDFVETLPVVKTNSATNVDVDNKKAVLHGTITEVGNPAYTERGFVLSTEYEQPSIYDNKIIVSGTGAGDYEYRLTDFSTTTKTYIRAYAINHKGVAYGETIILFDPSFIDKGDYVILGDHGLAVQKTNIGKGYLSTMSLLCQNSSVGSYTDWRLPKDRGELSVLYNYREKIGGFDAYHFWCTERNTSLSGTYYYYLTFSNGAINSSSDTNNNLVIYGRCVRSIQ